MAKSNSFSYKLVVASSNKGANRGLSKHDILTDRKNITFNISDHNLECRNLYHTVVHNIQLIPPPPTIVSWLLIFFKEISIYYAGDIYGI